MLFGRKSGAETPAEPPAATQGKGASTPVTTPTQLPGEAPPVVHKRLGELLIDEGLIKREHLDAAIAEQQKSGGFIGQILVKQGVVSQSAVASCLVKQCKIPHLSLLDYEVSKDVLNLLPEDLCRKYHILPIDKLGRILTVAMVDPLDISALEEVKAHCPELRIKPILCNWEHYELVARKIFAKENPAGDGGNAYTTEGLGLGKSDPTPKPAAAASPAPAPARPASGPQAVPAPAGQAAAGSNPAELAAAVRDSVRDAMQDAVRAFAAQAAPQVAPAGPATSTDQIVDAIRTAMHEAVSALAQRAPAAAPAAAPGPTTAEFADVMRRSVQEAVSAVASELRPVAAPVSSDGAQAAAAPSAAELGRTIRDGVSAAMQESLAGLVTHLQAASGPAAVPATPSAEDFAHAVQESVGLAMQEAMAMMVTQLKAALPKREEGGDNVAASVRQALEPTLQAQEAQSLRLAQIAEAALESVQQQSRMIEAAAVTNSTMRDLQKGRQARHASVTPFAGGPTGEQAEDEKVAEALESDIPLLGMTFDNFIPGNTNAFTHKLSQAVAANPGGEYNPFFLYGHVGTGKTHLISAIGNHILASKARVGYVSASHFSRRLKDALGEGALDAFREHYAHWDVLILDDIQFLGGRIEAQEEFFHIFNALRQQGRQIIIASDKAPDRLGLLEQRLISRFSSGIVAELKAPEWEARLAILRRFAEQSNTKVPDEVLSLIAMRVPNDVRKMTGSLRKIVAFAQLVGQNLSCELAEEILSHLAIDVAA